MAGRPGLGITLPLRRGATGYFTQAFDPSTQVRSNLINLLSTIKGERIFNPTFGCDIHSLVFDAITPTMEMEVEAAIQEAVSIWIPQLNVRLDRITRDIDNHRVEVTVSYALRSNDSVVGNVTLVF